VAAAPLLCIVYHFVSCLDTFVFATVLTLVRITHWRRLYKTKKHTVQYGPAHEGVCMCVCEGERLLSERALGRKRSTGENREGERRRSG